RTALVWVTVPSWLFSTIGGSCTKVAVTLWVSFIVSSQASGPQSPENSTNPEPSVGTGTMVTSVPSGYSLAQGSEVPLVSTSHSTSPLPEPVFAIVSTNV